MRFYLIGFMGAGKSFLGKQLSELLQAPFFDLDEFIVEKEQKSINQIFEQKGESYFREVEHECLLELSSQHTHAIIATGGGTPCFYENMNWMNQNGTTIWLNPGIDILVERLEKEKEHRPLLKSLDHFQLKQFIQLKLEERIKFYEKSKFQVNNESLSSVDELIKIIKHA